MKTRTVLTIALMMILTISGFSQTKNGNKQAGNSPVVQATAEIVQRDADHVIVWLDKSDRSRARITITDADGEQLYLRKIETPNKLKITNDISAFPKGRYFIEINVDGKTIASMNIKR